MPGPPPELRRGRPLSKRAAGVWGEDLALRYLTQRGYQLLERNYRTRFNELDLILRHGNSLMLVLLHETIPQHAAHVQGAVGGDTSSVSLSIL